MIFTGDSLGGALSPSLAMAAIGSILGFVLALRLARPRPEKSFAIRTGQIQLAGTLQGVISQRLLPAIGGGRVAAYEVLMANDAVRNLIREGKTRQIRNVIATSSAEGMQTLEASLNRLIADRAITYDEALSICQYPKELVDPSGPRGR